MKCKQCVQVEVPKSRKFCSQKCYWRSLEGIKGENAPNYREVVGKSQVHKWLDKHYGRPKVCENNDCASKAKWFDWALKKGCSYLRSRDNFLRLCRSCHRKYDLTAEKRQQAIENLKRFNPYYGTER